MKKKKRFTAIDFIAYFMWGGPVAIATIGAIIHSNSLGVILVGICMLALICGFIYIHWLST